MISNKAKNKTQTVKEFELISKDGSFGKKIDETFYKELEEFAKTDDGSQVLQFTKNGRCLQAKNYVGTIQTKSGFMLEILPKTLNANEQEEKEIFIKLLRILYKLPNYRHIDRAKFDKLKKMEIFEIFIYMFLEEVLNIIKKGLKSDYITKEDNLFYLKGKLIIKEQINKNFINKERFYARFDEYSQNRAENRLIKATLQKLSKISKDQNNKRLLNQCLEHMSNVEISTNYKKDFMLVKKNCDMKYYENALIWAKVFLKQSSFSTFSGSTIAFAILYPMEKLFEAFVGWYLKKKLPNLTIQEQVYKKDFVKGIFGVKPDFIIKKENKTIGIADAKWKIINNKDDFTQSDFYQMYAYRKRFLKSQTNSLRLYYPKTRSNSKDEKYIYFDGSKISIKFLDLKEELLNKK